jgi:hypothetical protein
MDALVGAPGWIPIVAAALGVPTPRMRAGGVLGDRARAVADFRDAYYGLAGIVREGGEGIPLVTSGLIDPATCLWGRRPARLHGRLWRAPTVRMDDLEERGLAAWARGRLAPKVMVAPQGRVIEAAPDPGGRFLPVTPVVSLLLDAADAARTTAVLTSPPATAWALTRAAGLALGTDGFRLSAPVLTHLPTPAGRAAWERAAGCRDGLAGAAALMCAAYEVERPDELTRWWLARLPARRG